MKNIKQLSVKQLAGKTAIVRVDFNVPFKAGKIAETFRIDQVWSTIDYLLKKRAKILLISHLGDEGASLAPVAKYLSRRQKTKLATNFKQAQDLLKENNLVLLENLRLWPGEKNNDAFFAKELSNLGDIYINDAFSVSHRAHASVVGLPKFLPSYAGWRLVTRNKKSGSSNKAKITILVVLGALSFKTKIPLIKKLSKADKYFWVAFVQLIFQSQDLELACRSETKKCSYIKPFLKKKNLRLPIDVTIANAQGQTIKDPTAVLKKEAIFDIGPETLAEIAEATKGAKTVLWNGPLGWFEKGYTKGTLETAKILAKTKAFTVIGGGDTLAAIKKLKLEDKFGFISTGGGAMLDYIASGGKLAGLKLLE